MATARPNALHSLFGGKVARLRRIAEEQGNKALAGNVGGQKRNQTVLSPDWFIGQLIQVYGPLGYDPCTTPWNPLKAKVFSTKKTDGFKVSWALTCRRHGWIYVNPPYDDLKRWMERCNREADAGAQILLLAPFRPWRTWFCDLLEGRPVVSLAPMPFVGEKSAYPAPLCVVPYNLEIPVIVNPRGKNMITGVWSLAA
jgi:hypothetical protein